MSKIQLYKYAAIGLLVLNLTLLGFFMQTKGGPPPHMKPPHKVLNLTSDQEKLFHEFVREHQNKMASIDKQQATLLANFFKTATEDTPAPIPPGLETLNKDKIEATYQHLIQVKSLLTEDQLPHFDKFVERLLMHIERRPPPRRPHHKK